MGDVVVTKKGNVLTIQYRVKTGKGSYVARTARVSADDYAKLEEEIADTIGKLRERVKWPGRLIDVRPQ